MNEFPIAILKSKKSECYRLSTFSILILLIFFLMKAILPQNDSKDKNLNSYYISENMGYTYDAVDSNTTLIGEWRAGECRLVRTFNNVAYIAKEEGGYPYNSHYLVSVNISNPSNPYELGNFKLSDFINDMKIRIIMFT